MKFNIYPFKTFLKEREAKQAKEREEDAETEDNQTKKECEDFSRVEDEDVESQYSLDDETIFTKAGTSSVEAAGQEQECHRSLLTQICSAALLGMCRSLFVLLSSCNTAAWWP